MSELQKSRALQRMLGEGRMVKFTRDDLKKIPTEQGVYVVYNKKQQPAHVGRTVRGKYGLRQRLMNHYWGRSSFVRVFLRGDKEKLRKECMFRYVVMKGDRTRALLEAYLIGILCPRHIGTGRARQ